MALVLFAVTILVLLLGFPVAFSLAGTAVIFACIAAAFGAFDLTIFGAVPSRLYGIMTNETLIAVPLFVFMGTVLERCKISEALLETMGQAFKQRRGGLAIAICVVGAILAASTGIVGATVVTMGLISLPVMLRHHYHPALACGVITASGTLGQIIPPSIVLVLLGDVISNANQKAQLTLGNYAPDTVSVGDLFFGALIPGLLLVGLYIVYIIVLTFVKPNWAPPLPPARDRPSVLHTLKILLPPLFLIVAVLGSILTGTATPTESAAMGAGGALLLAWMKKTLTIEKLTESLRQATHITCMVFVILIGASIFSLVFRGLGGDELVASVLGALPGGVVTAFLAVMLLMFLLGFFLDFIEIIFVVVPIVAPILIMLGLDPVWLGVMIAINLQTSFLTPPFGFALFYLRGIAPPAITTRHLYWGAVPFIIIQLGLLLALWFFPQVATWLPKQIYA